MNMKAATTSGLALVIAAYLFLCPMGFCAPTADAPSKPSHPCCPAKHAPAQSDLPGCSLLFLNTGSVPSVFADADLCATVFDSFDSVVLWDRDVTAVPLAATPPFAARSCFVTFHQFRI
jgi:hypothetical protein